MSKYVIDSSTLTSIADAVRTKGGTTDPIVVSDIPTAITNLPSGGGGDLPEEALVISGNCDKRFANNGWNWYIEQYGDRITTNDITDASNMFDDSKKITKVPFDLNFMSIVNYHNLTNIFSNCHNLRQLHKLNNVKVYSTTYMFNNCFRLRTIPDDIADTWDWSYLESQTWAYTGK